MSINEAVCCEDQTNLGSFHLLRCTEKVLDAFSRFFVQKLRCLLWSSDTFWTFSTCKVYRKKLQAECQDICVLNRRGLLWSSDESRKFSPCKVTEKVLGAFSWFLRPKTKLSAVKFRCIFDVFALNAWYKMFWTHFHDLCVLIRSCLPLNWDAFWSSLPASFIEKVLGTISRFVHAKTKLFEVRFRRILEVLRMQVLKKKFWVWFHDLCVQKRSCFLCNSDAFRKYSACKVYRKLWAQFHDLCVKKWSGLLWSSDAF